MVNARLALESRESEVARIEDLLAVRGKQRDAVLKQLKIRWKW